MTENKLTAKEVIKALECCTSDEWDICDKCPYQKYKTEKGCTYHIVRDALDLINRQQAENKELKTENLILSQKRFNIFERIEFTDKLKKQIKSEAIKDFAERLLPLLYEDVFEADVITENIIDDLVKEMVGK